MERGGELMPSGDLVVGYDGRGGGEAALEEGIRLAVAMGGRLVLVFAYEPAARAGGELGELRDTLRQMGAALEIEAEERVREAGVDYELVLIDSRPAQGLVQVANERDARMIIVGGAGEAPFSGLLLGGTPHKVLQLTDRPVLVVRAAA
jgi:nucleotide-binding universal stress UspA family protein